MSDTFETDYQTKIRYSDVVHETPDGRWQVAELRDGRYYRPMTSAERKLTGAHTVCGSLDYVRGPYCYKRRADARRAARDLFGRC